MESGDEGSALYARSHHLPLELLASLQLSCVPNPQLALGKPAEEAAFIRPYLLIISLNFAL